ncbi:MAG: NAD-dependent epimerase/dehydratase family protein [Bacteroidetes bacterium]|nr:NAD-dependent epimerase/dehydratase family protein [Bacteroidota bacterium]
MHESKRILVTGASGFLGRHVVSEMLASGYLVRALVRRKDHPALAPFAGRVEIAEGDILDTDALAEACKDVWGIIHAAATVSFYKPRRALLKRVNHEGTAHVVNCALDTGVQKLVYVSSIGALGPPDKNGLLHEGCKWVREDAVSWYGYTKHLGELEVHRGVAEGLPAVICNPSMIIGPGDWHTSSPALVRSVAKGLRFYPKGGNGFVGVWDVARACRLLLESDLQDGERFVLNSENLSFRDFFSRTAVALDKKPPFIPVPTIPAQMTGWLIERWADLFGGEPLLTRETAASSGRTRRFSADRFRQQFTFAFEPMEEVICKTANAYTHGTAR